MKQTKHMQHLSYIQQREFYRGIWGRKPILHKIYHDFFEAIAQYIPNADDGSVMEIGSGIGSSAETIPDCIRTELSPGPHINLVQNVYHISLKEAGVNAIFMVDVFHHLQYPGDALDECFRVLRPGGRLILLEPFLGVLGLIIYSLFHSEPVGILKSIRWHCPMSHDHSQLSYYAAQGNATRIFSLSKYAKHLQSWKTIKCNRMSALGYIFSGGFTGPQLCAQSCMPIIRTLEKLSDRFPLLFGTRMLIVLEK